MRLDANKVEEIFEDSIYKEDEIDQSNAIIVHGITMQVCFNPKRLNNHAEEIVTLLNELDDNFKESVGGGYSFLGACYDKHGSHWGEHRDMEELFVLGIAINKVSYLLPRELWQALPGALPYLVIKN